MKKPSKKKSINKSEFFDEVNQYLIDNHEWEEGDLSRKDVKNIVESVVQIAIDHSTDRNGCIIPGLGKIYWNHRKASEKRKMKSPFNGEMITVKAKKERWVPKLRLLKAGKDAMDNNYPKK